MMATLLRGFLCLLYILATFPSSQVRGKAVFAHFMVGNANNYTQADWVTDIKLAQEAHIDGFALNIANGVSAVMPALNLAFYVANQLGFKLFLSLDYAGNGPWSKQDVIGLCALYCYHPAYYQAHGGPMISTFEGPANAEDWHELKAQTGCFLIPDWSSLGAKAALEQSDGVADALFSWDAWPWGDWDMDTYGDASYWYYLSQSGNKPYMMPASPWFYTNLPGYGKNWLWRGDHIWYDRWVQIIYNQPEFVEIISWNDYGESHYIGPLYEKAMEAFTIGEAPYYFAEGYPHDGWRAFLPYLIDTYKYGSAPVTKEGVQGWWRRSSASSECEDGGTTGNTATQLQIESPPSQILEDAIFFSALLASDASVSVTVGGTALTASWSRKPDGGVGLYHGSASFGSYTGDVVITISRGGSVIASSASGANGAIGPQSCKNGISNYNAFVDVAWGGSVSATPTLQTSDMVCVNGTGAFNFAGICDFSCAYGYCPVSSCVCKAMGHQVDAPNVTDPRVGYPAAGLDASYSGVCAFDCEHGYCPSGACSYEESPLTVPTVSDFQPPYCTSGSAIAGPGSALSGLCSYACNYGFCPYHVCNCDTQGPLNVPPAQTPGLDGKAASSLEDSGLCAFACSRDYCPSPTCVNTGLGGDTGTGLGGVDGAGGVFEEVDPGWSTGQYCYTTSCMDNSKLSNYYDEHYVPASTPFQDDCSDGQSRLVLCPYDGAPGNCTWRGTGPWCGATNACLPDEVQVAGSLYGDTPGDPCVSTSNGGQKNLCCHSDTWEELVGSCNWLDVCPDNQKGVATRTINRCFVLSGPVCQSYYEPITENLCCDSAFPNCQWASCADGNTCSSSEIELALDSHGATGFGCEYRTWIGGRPVGGDEYSQALCCGTPANTNPFIPTELDWLFPNPPPDTDVPDFIFDHVGSQHNSALNLGPLEAFGMVVIDGPADLVSSLSKRDGSHVEFLDCESTTQYDFRIHRARYVCMDDSSASNCDDVHWGGAEGTIVKLPEECGFATYGVVHSIRPSPNTTIPHELRDRVPKSSTVFELSFSYDFTRVKRASDSDPVYVRIDYGSESEWFRKIVDAAPVLRKRDDPPTTEKRFWSSDEEVWKQQIAAVRNRTDTSDNQLLPISSQHFDKLIYQQTSDICAAINAKRELSDDGFLSISLNGYFTAMLRWGYSMVGTISPTLQLEEAHGFFDILPYGAGTIFVDGNGDLDIEGSLPPALVFPDVVDYGWSHPGLVEFAPSIGMSVQLAGKGHLDANFTYAYYKFPGTEMFETNSAGMGDFVASFGDAFITHDYAGDVDASLTEGTPDDGAVFGLRLTPQAKMNFKVFQYENEDVASGDGQFSIEIPHEIQVQREGSTVSVTDSYPSAVLEVYSDGISPVWESDDAAHLLDTGIDPAVVHSSDAGEPPEDRQPPNLSGEALFGGDYMTCSATGTVHCYNLSVVGLIDPDLYNDEDGENEAAGTSSVKRLLARILEIFQQPREAPELEPRATRDPFTVRTASGTTFTTTSSSYVTGSNGANLLAANPSAGRYDLADFYDCASAAVTNSGDQSSSYATEHIVELNTFPDAWSFMLTGLAPSTSRDGEISTRFTELIVDNAIMGGNSPFRQNWGTWDPNGAHADPNTSPEREIWDAMGSLLHPDVLVNIDKVLNGMKSRMWRGINGISEARWIEEGWDVTTPDQPGVPGGAERANRALSELRLFPAVFSYLNEGGVNGNLVSIATRMDAIFAEFDDAVQRNGLNNGNTISTSTLWREYFHEVTISRLERTQDQYREFLERLQDTWAEAATQAEQATTPDDDYIAQIGDIRQQIKELLTYDPIRDNFSLNTDGLFPPPAP